MLAAALLGSNDANKQSGGFDVPGMSGTSGNGQTLAYLYGLKQFAGLDSSNFTTQLWVDPYYGSDSGDGTYQNPYRSLAKFKIQCLLKSHMRCTVKGRNRVFSHTMWQADLDPGATPLEVGDLVTFTNPAGTATVLATDGVLVVTTWVSGADPKAPASVGASGVTTFAGPVTPGGSSTGAVFKVIDTINGNRNIVIFNGDITLATDVIAASGHDYVTGDGPFLWYNQTTMPTFTGTAITENSTDVYICNVVPGVSFKVGTTSGCGTTFDFLTLGAGTHQLIFKQTIASPGLLDTVKLDCPQTGKICTLFESEFAESPWTIDGNRLYPNGAIALYTSNGNGVDTFWSGVVAGGVYNPPIGGIFLIASDASDPHLTPWLGVQNGVIQNLSHDGIASNAGGKIVALNVKVPGTRNGFGDRSMAGFTNPQYQGHNSIVTATGANGTATAAVTWMLNADGSSDEAGNDQRSGSMINPGSNGVVRLISQGRLTQDSITGDTNCAGTVCPADMIAAPGGDVVIIGPELKSGGTGTDVVGISWSGDQQRFQFAKMLFNFNNVWAGAQNGIAEPAVVKSSAATAGKAKLGRAWETTFRAAGPQKMFYLCPLGGTDTTKALATQTLDMRMKNILLEGWTGNYIGTAENCGKVDSVASPYTVADAFGRATIQFEGIKDRDDSAACAPGPCFLYNPNARTIGLADGSTNPSFYRDVQTNADSAGNTPTAQQFRWFADNSFDSGTDGVNGTQWGTTVDASFRCQSGKDCYHFTQAAGGNVPYTVDLASYFTGNKQVACLPADVVGGTQPLCSLTLTPVHVGGR